MSDRLWFLFPSTHPSQITVFAFLRADCAKEVLKPTQGGHLSAHSLNLGPLYPGIGAGRPYTVTHP